MGQKAGNVNTSESDVNRDTVPSAVKVNDYVQAPIFDLIIYHFVNPCDIAGGRCSVTKKIQYRRCIFSKINKYFLSFVAGNCVSNSSFK